MYNNCHISSSELWSFPFCAHRWRPNWGTCGSTRYVSVIFSTFLHSTKAKNNSAEITNPAWTSIEMHCCGFLGPFVMTTEEEIQQAISDYQSGRNGFERARNWRSKIAGSFWNSARCIYLFVSVVAEGFLFCSIFLLELSDICVRIF